MKAKRRIATIMAIVLCFLSIGLTPMPVKAAESSMISVDVGYDIEKSALYATWNEVDGAQYYNVTLYRLNTFKPGGKYVEIGAYNTLALKQSFTVSEIERSGVAGTDNYKFVVKAYTMDNSFKCENYHNFTYGKKSELKDIEYTIYGDGRISVEGDPEADKYVVSLYRLDTMPETKVTSKTSITSSTCNFDFSDYMEIGKYYEYKIEKYDTSESRLSRALFTEDFKFDPTVKITKQPPAVIYYDAYYDSKITLSVEAENATSYYWTFKGTNGLWNEPDGDVESATFEYRGVGGAGLRNKNQPLSDDGRILRCEISNKYGKVYTQEIMLVQYKSLMDYSRTINLAPFKVGDLIDFTGDKTFSSDTYSLDPEYGLSYAVYDENGRRVIGADGKIMSVEPGDRFKAGYRYEACMNIRLPEDVYKALECYNLDNDKNIIVNGEPCGADVVDYGEPYGATVFWMSPVLEVPAGHTHKYDSSDIVKTPATLTTDGSISKKCYICDEIQKTVISRPKTITLANTTYTYTGSQIKPAVTVKDATGAVISSTNYTVTYGTNTSAGEGTVTITFKGNYSGTKKLTFKINPKATGISSLANASTGITVKWAKNDQATGYYLYRSVNGGAYSLAKNITSNATVSYTDTAATTNGAKYQYKLVAYKTVSSTTYKSAESAVKTIYRVNAVGISSLTNASSGVTIKWAKNASATGYKLYRSVNGGAYSLLKTITSNATVSYTDTTATTNGAKYQYKMVAYKTVSGTTFTSTYCGVKTIYRVKPVGISSLTNATTGITVKWAKNDKATGYKLYRSVNGGAFSLLKTITSNATLSYTDTKATTNGAKYQYKIVAYKTVSGATYTSTYSGAKTIYRLSRPAISSATNTAAGKVTVKWNKNDKASGYKIKYTVGTTTKTVKVTGAATVSKVLSSLTKGKTYSISVQSYKMVGSTPYYSAWSAAKNVKITK